LGLLVTITDPYFFCLPSSHPFSVKVSASLLPPQLKNKAFQDLKNFQLKAKLTFVKQRNNEFLELKQVFINNFVTLITQYQRKIMLLSN
jgi:hypothetical protein